MRVTHVLTAAIAVGCALSAHSEAESFSQADAEAYLSAKLVDFEGSSVKDVWPATYEGEAAWCFHINPRNSYGGLTGWTYMVVAERRGVLTHEEVAASKRRRLESLMYRLQSGDDPLSVQADMEREESNQPVYPSEACLAAKPAD